MNLLRTSSLGLALVLLAVATAARAGDPLPGTQPLEMEGDLASEMVDGIDRFLLREIEESRQRRTAGWNADFSSPEAYAASLAPQRERLRFCLGATDERVSPVEFERVSKFLGRDQVGRTETVSIHAIRWPVFRNVAGEGLLLVPQVSVKELRGACIVLPDADQSPELLAGLAPDGEATSAVALRLAESGYLVVVPTLIDRTDTHSITAAGRRTNQPHREFVYRPAFEMGRHAIGYEVQKVLAAVDGLRHFLATVQADANIPSVGIAGYGEGGLVALDAAALDPRLGPVLVSGYFAPREEVWREPIYRNVYGLLERFGDAELAALIAPRALIVEASAVPAIDGPPPPGDGRGGAAPGALTSPDVAAVEAELDRARGLVEKLTPPPRMEFIASGEGQGPAFSGPAVEKFVEAMAEATGRPAELREADFSKLENRQPDFDPQPRLKRQFDELIEDTQHLMRESEYVRRQSFWAKLDTSSLSAYEASIAPLRDEFYRVLGRFDRPLSPANPRTRQVAETDKYTTYEVVLDVFPDVFAYGLLLVPRDVAEGERRPVVVCQHGLEGRPQDTIGEASYEYYKAFAARLAEEGFVTYAPQNPYIFQDRFRTLQRKLNPLGKSLYSVIVPQHQQTVDWLGSLPFVDPRRIGFYGLSYGGKTAMRVPALVEGYCLSICSGDFNEWIWKNVSLREPFTYPGTGEYEMFDFNLGHTFNYAEMAALIAPRPFMVERGHRDGVGIDEWVSYEYAKVRRLYADLKIPERTTIEFFDGPHTINGVGTYEFLRGELRGPEGE